MNITIQPLKKGYAISLIDTYIFPNMNQHEVVQEANKLSDLVFYSKTEPRPVIKWLPIQHTPVMRVSPGFVEKMDNIINSNLLMKKTKKANKLKKAVTAKAKKALKAKKK